MGTNSNDILAALHEVCGERGRLRPHCRQTHPEHIAIAEGDTFVTYQQLWQQARRVAEYVKTHGGDSPFVGLNLPKSAAYIVSMIGCWMAGKAFVPIGTDLPQARRSYIKDHAGISLCLDKESFAEAMACGEIRSVAKCLPETPAYMIYSSGTTGTPKGILVGHAGLCNLARCQQRGFAVDSHSRYLFFLSVNFDASVSDILVTLTSGATLVIEPMPPEELASRLFEVVAKRGVTHTDIPPSLLRILSPDLCPDCLQTIVIGGEAADISTVRRWSRRLRLVNVYGPTEATVCTSMCQCTPQWDAPLLGDVLDHTQYHVYADGRLDAKDGELWISGIGLAIGYYKDEELTRRKFPVVDGVRYYRTSDHVRMNGEQQLVFVGRIDRQVKYHGQLIELEEIECRLRSHRHVRNVAVVKRCIDAEKAREAIVAWVQLTGKEVSKETVEHELRQCCKHHLPKWMMPALFEFVEHIPQTPSGKTDLQALSAMPLGKAVSLCGGDSLDTIILISKLQQMGIGATPAELRQTSTPYLLAQASQQAASVCIHSSQLESQWQVNRPSSSQSSAPTVNSSTPQFFLTGATGFLGSRLLRELLDRGQKVLCLVRCVSETAGLGRVRDTFRRYGIDPQELESVGIVKGDVTLPNLGLPNDEYRRLSEQVTDVVHCAATVNMLANYEELKPVNVTGTRNIIGFCLTGSRKRLHAASTLSVFVATDRNSGVAYESDDLSTPTNIYGGYGQTKFVAEKMVQAVSPAWSDVFTYRFGLLCGDTQHGISARKDFLSMFFRGAKTVGTLPYDMSDAMAVDITPIDQAAHIVADIIETGKPGVYHIASEHPLSYNHLCKLMQREGVIGDIVDYGQWLLRTNRFAENVDVQALRMALCRMDAALFSQMRHMDLFQTTNIRFDMANTHAATRQRCNYDEELIRLYIRQSL